MDIIISRETNKRMHHKQVNRIKIKTLTNLKESQEKSGKIVLNRQFKYETNKTGYKFKCISNCIKCK